MVPLVTRLKPPEVVAPSFVEIRGFCRFKELESHGLTGEEIKIAISAFRTAMSSELQRCFDWERTAKEQGKFHKYSRIKFLFVPSHTQQVRWETMRDVKACIDSAGGELDIKSRTPYCVLEVSPAEKPFNVCIAKLFGALESQGFQQTPESRRTLRMHWNSLSSLEPIKIIYKDANMPQEIAVARLQRGSGQWIIDTNFMKEKIFPQRDAERLRTEAN
jgi:hypothetical protein